MASSEEWDNPVFCNTYDSFDRGGKYYPILELLFNQQINPGKAVESIAEISVGIKPALPELRDEE